MICGWLFCQGAASSPASSPRADFHETLGCRMWMFSRIHTALRINNPTNSTWINYHGIVKGFLKSEGWKLWVEFLSQRVFCDARTENTKRQKWQTQNLHGRFNVYPYVLSYLSREQTCSHWGRRNIPRPESTSPGVTSLGPQMTVFVGSFVVVLSCFVMFPMVFSYG